MKSRLIKIRGAMADSFWFVPTVMALAAVAAAPGFVALDESLGDDWLADYGWLWSGGPDGARTMMATVAGSLITVISIVFSLTITTLAQTATHFGPRVLRNFTSDRGVQITLGTFIATFVYCLLVMRTVRSVDESQFVPYAAVNLGFLMTLASLAVLIYFIDHVSKSIQAENLIASVGRDFQDALPVLFPKQIGAPGDPAEDQPPPAERWLRACTVPARQSGYMQHVDENRLIDLAARHDLVIKLMQRPGDFIVCDAPLMKVLSAAPPDDDLQNQLRDSFVTGGHRTPHQDGLYPVQQLVEIAAHALSPGINEPFTAITCIDWLGACLRGVALSDEPSAFRRDENHRLRIIARPLGFEEVASVAFDQIRVSGAGNPDVAAHLFRIISSLAPILRRTNDCQVLIRQVRIIGREIGRIANEEDRQKIEALRQAALETLEQNEQLEN